MSHSNINLERKGSVNVHAYTTAVADSRVNNTASIVTSPTTVHQSSAPLCKPQIETPTVDSSRQHTPPAPADEDVQETTPPSPFAIQHFGSGLLKFQQSTPVTSHREGYVTLDGSDREVHGKTAARPSAPVTPD